ncbi:insulinase family protein [Bacillaceae bacterium SIJ1]|uniref:EF-P 5-aminopentanol modification-associated protein YfmF n=1 Tax=Litoribacterium kuwaitense TaxID=1398745 RepID=UPI0013EDE990|nr:pitrilysin family protein [Litoribacterium kuwaitense]NGP44072.1 insulinase family protein [Litoribacterium kuwaitense]
MTLEVYNEKAHEVNGFHVHLLKNDSFKTNTLILKLRAPLDEKTVAGRALLAQVLESATEKFPTTKSLRSELERLYGARLDVDVSKKGNDHLITFRVDMVNEKFLKEDSSLLETAIQMLSDVLLRPAMDNGQFKADIVEREKRALIQRLDAILDDKMRYAGVRLIEEMCANEVFRLHPYGERQAIRELEMAELVRMYQAVLMNDQMDLYVVGDVEEDDVIALVSRHFQFPNERSVQSLKSTDAPVTPTKVKDVQEAQDIMQGKLNIGYRVAIDYASDDYFALQVMNGIFGGFSHSKLFINVREKESLAYYAASRLESHKGLLLVMSGIEFEQFTKTRDIIIQQMEDMQKGRFSETEVAQTKAMIRNQLLEMLDTPRGIVEMLYNNRVAGTNRTVENWLEGIQRVKNDDIIAVANKATLDTVYFLKGLEA